MKVEFVNESVVPAEEWTALVKVRVSDESTSPYSRKYCSRSSSY